MEGKFDITTFFRTVMPGYVFLLVIFTLKPQWFSLEIKSITPLLALLGLPIGYLAQELNRCFFYLLDWETIFDRRDLIYIAVDKKIRRYEDKEKDLESFTREDIFHYSTVIDYLLFTEEKPRLKELNEHLRFLYTRMHSYSATAVAIFFGMAVFIASTPECWTSKILRIIFWGFIACALIYTRFATATRISWWRRQIVDRNQPIIEGYFAKNIKPVSGRA